MINLRKCWEIATSGRGQEVDGVAVDVDSADMILQIFGQLHGPDREALAEKSMAEQVAACRRVLAERQGGYLS